MIGRKIRLQHVVIQTVLVLDDGDELHAGPQVQPVVLPLSRVAAWADAMPAEIARLQGELDGAQADQGTPHDA